MCDEGQEMFDMLGWMISGAGSELGTQDFHFPMMCPYLFAVGQHMSLSQTICRKLGELTRG